MKRRTDDNARSKIPLGIPSIDARLHGGVRPGTTLLAMGPFGSGYREFLRTAAILHGNWQAESGLFELEYGDVEASVRRPTQVRYVALNETDEAFRRHVHDLADDDVVYPALDHVTVESLAAEMAELGPMRPSSETGFEYVSKGKQSGDQYERLFEKFDDLIGDTENEIVIIDSISDFLPVTSKFLDPVDLYFVSQTLCHVVSNSDSVLIAGADADILDRRNRALLMRSFEATLEFGWFGEGMQKRRTLTVTDFPEFWRESDEDDVVTFDLKIDRDRFGISNIKKIPPRQ